mgnify:CR=1 FL=1
MQSSTSQKKSLFGKVRMGYLVVESKKLAEWKRFASEGLGIHVDQPEVGVLTGRIDAHMRRLIVLDGPQEDVVAIGWQLDDDDSLLEVLHRLKSRQIGHTEIKGPDAFRRGVTAFWRVTGPKGMSIELFTSAHVSDIPLNMKASGFVTGDGGMGHVAISTRRPQDMQSFWCDILDARLSDHIEERIDGVDLELTFLRLNSRHHSVATAATRGIRLNPLRTQIHHFNLQAATLDDVIQGYLRCRRMGYDIASGVGQHPNDREISFYVVSPSGFEVEIGWDPLLVDEARWVSTTHRGISLWGHRPENLTLSYRARRLVQGVRSLMSKEYSPQENQP